MTGREPRPALDAREPLRLHENENPYGCSLLVQESLSIYDAFSRTPGPLPRSLMLSLSRYAGRPPERLYLANSPEELLERVLSVLVPPGGEVVAYAPYGRLLRHVSSVSGIPVRPVERGGDLRARAEGVLEATGGAPGVVYVGSPNDPTGDATPPLELVTLLHGGYTVVADESYVEFTSRSLGMLGSEFPSFVSLRGFGPWAGLWGIPVSYAVTSPDLVRELESRWPQTLVSAASRVAADASLEDSALLLNRVRHLRLERARLFRRLRKLNFVEPIPSHGPFVSCAVTRGTAEGVCELLEAEGILVHNCVEDGWPGHVRISVGTAEQTDELFRAMCRIAVAV